MDYTIFVYVTYVTILLQNGNLEMTQEGNHLQVSWNKKPASFVCYWPSGQNQKNEGC